MPSYFAYHNTIRDTQTTINGSPHNYHIAPSGTWRYTGSTFTHVVYEEDDNATNYNGDNPNEVVHADERLGSEEQQSTEIGGSQRAVIYDYSFLVSDGTTTYEVAIIDIDVNNDNDLNGPGGIGQYDGEDGYYLVFIGAVPPPDTDLTVTDGTFDNSVFRSHEDMGGQSVCFATDTLIMTENGEVPVQNLKIGGRVLTIDHGPQPIRWIGRQSVSVAELEAAPELRPVCVCADALGPGIPETDLVVSQQHRVLVRSAIAQRMFGTSEALIAAKHLCTIEGIDIDHDVMGVEYFHLMFDQHEVIIANGVETESLYAGSQSLHSIGLEARHEIFLLFPELQMNAYIQPPARLFVPGRKARKLAARHNKNGKPLLQRI